MADGVVATRLVGRGATTGNTPITIGAAQGLLANDSDPDGPEASLLVTAVNTAGEKFNR